ncbi:MAG: 3-dehydroquinate synthase [Phycisphaera sp.]|nr:3-dehydroquinate synthase [Phycisphaera sp.]
MATVNVNLPHHTYDVIIEPGALQRLGQIVRALAPQKRAALLGDGEVMNIYGGAAVESLKAAGYDVTTGAIPTGEENKNLDTVRKLYDVMLNDRLERRSPVIALGGGVNGDTVGFVAATYLRGVPFVQCPTTLLAMVDASVGGKVGVNVPQGKNLIGAFYQPVVVVIDPMVLQTLPPRELRCGLAECIKHGVIRDESLCTWIADNVAKIQALDMKTMTDLVARNVAIKAAVVQADEKESGERAHLNFGHTFAHAIEATAGYGTYHHGEAVSIGMVAAAQMAADLGMCDASVHTRIVELCNAVGLPTSGELPDTDTLMDAMRLDKKVADAKIRFVLPDAMGHVVIRNDIDDAAVRAAWETVRA